MHKVLLSSANNLFSIAKQVVSFNFCVDLHTWLSGVEPHAEQ